MRTFPEVSMRSEPAVLAFEPGDVIFHEGEASDEVFLVAEGAVELLDAETSVRQAGPGDIVGESALADRAPRTLTAVASTACWLVAIDQERFNSLVRHSPQFARHLMLLLGSQLAQLSPAWNQVALRAL